MNWKPGVAPHRLIRPAFQKSAVGWQAIPPGAVTHHTEWTVAFDGKSLGTIEGESSASPDAAESDTQCFTSVQRIVSGRAPNIGEASQKFAGLMAIGPTKVRRPLVVVNKPFFLDPDGWKRTEQLSAGVKRAIREAFRREYPYVDRCGTEEEVIERDWKFPDSALEFSVMYASNKRSFLVETDLHAGMCGFVNDPNDPLAHQWFFVAADGATRRIGGFMTLIDAGDYDHDGKSELVFFLSQPEDTDGFVLFDGDLREQARLTWHYH